MIDRKKIIIETLDKVHNNIAELEKEHANIQAEKHYLMDQPPQVFHLGTYKVLADEALKIKEKLTIEHERLYHFVEAFLQLEKLYEPEEGEENED
jgi:hypothetical protein